MDEKNELGLGTAFFARLSALEARLEALERYAPKGREQLCDASVFSTLPSGALARCYCVHAIGHAGRHCANWES